MMRRTVRRAGGISPYAQALKHIALRGKGAFGLTAREAEIAMARAGTLPADYRPPPETAWDDTTERWSYAWQFPVREEEESTSWSVAKSEDFPRLLDISRRLIDAPPSRLPRSKKPTATTSTRVLASTETPQITASSDMDDVAFTPSQSAGGAPGAAGANGGDGGAMFFDSEEELDAALLAQQSTAPASTSEGPHGAAEHTSRGTEAMAADLDAIDAMDAMESLPALSLEIEHPSMSPAGDVSSTGIVGASDQQSALLPMMPASEFSTLNEGLPVAYIDDGSEFSAVSRALGELLVETFDIPYDPAGVISAISALGKRGHTEEALALFQFVSDAGIEISPITYTALMEGFARKGDTDKVMALIEEMKEDGVTPERSNWHMLMMSFDKNGDHGSVLQVLDNMTSFANIEPNELTYFHHLRALSKDKSRESNVYEAVQLFDHMENVAGFMPTRQLYHVLMRCLAKSNAPDMRVRLEDTAKKMELIGMPWNHQTYMILLEGARTFGDLDRVQELCVKMRDEGMELTMDHLNRVVSAHTNSMQPHITNYISLREKNESPVEKWLQNVSTCFGLYELAQSRQWEITSGFVDALLQLCCTVTTLAVDHLPTEKHDGESGIPETAEVDALVLKKNTELIGKFEAQATALWEGTYRELNLQKTPMTYEHYISLLAHQQKIDAAESLFQELVIDKGQNATRRTYEVLMFMHLASGEEGATVRALHYMDAMERAGHHVRAVTLKKMKRVTEAASYTRDMKRRARRIMQAREEYLAKKQAEEDLEEFSSQDEKDRVDRDAKTATEAAAKAKATLASPLPLSASSTLQWWENWKAETKSKHELFETENADGTPRGEDFAEKNYALKELGIESQFLTKDSLPNQGGEGKPKRLIDKLRKDGSEPAGALWALDGGNLSYPNTDSGVESWGATFTRERMAIKKELDKAKDGLVDAPEFSPTGTAVRTTAEQLLIERTGAKNAGELVDVEQFPDHVYDDGTAKPASELAHAVPPSAELIWKKEQHEQLAPYRTADEAVELANDNVFMSELERDAIGKSSDAVRAIQSKEEELVDIVGKGVTRRSKYDYLDKWREMYRQGTLEPPDEALERFGRRGDDHKTAMAAQVRAWYEKNKREPPTKAVAEEQQREKERRQEMAMSREYRRTKGRGLHKKAQNPLK